MHRAVSALLETHHIYLSAGSDILVRRTATAAQAQHLHLPLLSLLPEKPHESTPLYRTDLWF